jgi:hypothetical protein
MEDAPENGKESYSAHAKGMHELYRESVNWNLKFTLISSVVLSLLMQLILYQKLNTLFALFFE